MLIIVMANPMQFTIVSAVPLSSGAVFCATKVENKGESATTHIPQKMRNPIQVYSALSANTAGTIKQQIPDNNKANIATRFVPRELDKYPPNMHPKLPTPMTTKDKNDTL